MNRNEASDASNPRMFRWAWGTPRLAADHDVPTGGRRGTREGLCTRPQCVVLTVEHREPRKPAEPARRRDGVGRRRGVAEVVRERRGVRLGRDPEQKWERGDVRW